MGMFSHFSFSISSKLADIKDHILSKNYINVIEIDI